MKTGVETVSTSAGKGPAEQGGLSGGSDLIRGGRAGSSWGPGVELGPEGLVGSSAARRGEGSCREDQRLLRGPRRLVTRLAPRPPSSPAPLCRGPDGRRAWPVERGGSRGMPPPRLKPRNGRRRLKRCVDLKPTPAVIGPESDLEANRLGEKENQTNELNISPRAVVAGEDIRSQQGGVRLLSQLRLVTKPRLLLKRDPPGGQVRSGAHSFHTPASKTHRAAPR